MKFASILLASVSMVTLMATASPAAQAIGNGVMVEAIGSLSVGPNTAAQNDVGGTDASTINPLTGGYAALRVGKQITPLLDFRVGVAASDLKGSASYTDFSTTPFTSDKVGTVSDELAFQTLDLEAGFTPALGSQLQMRFSAGLRGMHYTNSLVDSSTVTVSPPGFTDTETITTRSEFVGIGPKFGTEISSRFGNSPIGITVAANASIIAGSETKTRDKVGGIPGGSSSTATFGKTVVDLEASTGIDYHLNDNATLTLGVRGEAISGINDIASGPDDSQLTGGPFVKFKANF